MELTIGVIGLGNMGGEIAKRLSTKCNVIGFDVDDEKINKMEQEGVHCERSLEYIAKKVNYVVTSLPNAKISKSVLTEIVPHFAPGKVVIETSTILPSDVQGLAHLCKSRGVEVVDAAILGGVKHVAEGRASFLVGGNDETIEDVKEILKIMGSDITKVGDLGTGMSAKIINNAVAHNVMVLIVEAASIGIKVGIEPEKIYELLKGETTFKRPLTHRYKERILNGSYEGGMSTGNARKDSTLILKLAQQMKVPLFSIQASQTIYDIAISKGLETLDYASIATLWENWCEINFSPKNHNPESVRPEKKEGE